MTDSSEIPIKAPLGHENVFQIDPIEPVVGKKEFYEKMLGGVSPDAFFVLGGGNRALRNKQTGEIKGFRTSPYRGAFWDREEKPRSGGAKARPIAAVELSEFYPDSKIVTMSHRPGRLYQMAEQTTVSPDQPPFADVLAQDIERFRVSSDRIIKEPESTSTLTEMIEVVKMAAENGWQNVSIITNDYQIPRAQKIIDILKDSQKFEKLWIQVQALFEKHEERVILAKRWKELEDAIQKVKENNIGITFINAEDVLRKRSRGYQKLIDYLLETQQYKNVVEDEKVGDGKIDEGIYNFAQPTFKEYIMALESSNP